MYPTAAKLVAALGFAALSWIASRQVSPNLPEFQSLGRAAEVTAVIGLVLGWRISGRHAGRGMAEAAGIGVTTALAIVFWSTLIWAGYEMLDRALAVRYDGPLEGLEDMVSLMLDYAAYTWPGLALPVLGLGSIVMGLLVEMVSRREHS